MPTEIKKKIELEVVHVLFLDIVGYSRRLTNEQQTLIDQLNQVVRSSEEFQNAEAAGRLIKIPTGDGMALVFYKSPAQPVECALEISRALKTYPELRVRMGVHSGPVSAVTDLNDRTNAAGIGINIAQRSNGLRRCRTTSCFEARRREILRSTDIGNRSCTIWAKWK
jgi:class 3 adenylate cyclase